MGKSSFAHASTSSLGCELDVLRQIGQGHRIHNTQCARTFVTIGESASHAFGLKVHPL